MGDACANRRPPPLGSRAPGGSGHVRLARVDAEVAIVVAELDQAQRVILDALGSRLGIPHAPALLSVFASFDTYELLAGGFGMPELQIAQLLVMTADRALS